MHVDIVRADEGYVAIYVDGVLETWNDEDPYEMLIEAIDGKLHEPPAFRLHSLGEYGNAAAVFEDPSDRFEDIPPSWWSDAHDLDGDDE